MKRFLSMLAIAGATLSPAMAQETARVETISIDSEFFPFNREVFIYTPSFYDQATESDFDVTHSIRYTLK